MKKFVTIFFILFTAFALHAFSFSAGVDLRSFDSFLREGIRIDGELSFDVESFQIIIPVRYGKSNDYDLSLIESGILVSVHPWEGLGLFAEASLLKVSCMWGLYAPEEAVSFSSEGSVGWDFVFDHFYVRPKYTYRSSLSADDGAQERMKIIPQFGESRISVFIGITFGGKINEESNTN